MSDDFSVDDAIEFASGGFAAAATDSENVTPEVLARLSVHDDEPSRVELLAANTFGFFALFPRDSIKRACEQIKDYILGRGRPVTQEEFNVALGYDWLFPPLRRRLKDYAQQHGMTADELYSRTIDAINKNPAYKYISDDDKNKLAKRLTDGLVSK